MENDDHNEDLPIEAGSRAEVDGLLPLIYDELRRIAGAYLRNERAGHTLQPTALVHEAYMRLAQLRHMEVESRAHLLSLGAQQMRRVLVDHARARGTGKRGGELVRIELEETLIGGVGRDAELIALDTALDELARADARLGRIVELRYFGGLTIDETADVLGISHATVEREWAAARAWLRRALRQGAK
jgi:RNA polymerase sigma factor (TIGR02999 family)